MAEKNQDQAASLAQEGKSLFRSKHYQQAGEEFSRAAELYQEAGESVLAAEMRNNQAVALLMAGNPRQAEAVLEGTSQIFREAGDPLKQGMALANQATALKDLGNRQDAMEVYAQAGEIFRSAGEDQLFLQTMQSLSSLKMRSRDLAGALFTMQSGLEGLTEPTWRQRLLKNFLNIPNKLLGQ